MFYTVPASEIPTPTELTPNGERAWQWIEFGLNIPLFLVHFSDVEQAITRHMLLSRMEDLLSFISAATSDRRLLAIGLLSPRYLNHSDNYQLHWVTSIWRDQDDPRVFKYRGQNGVILIDDFFAALEHDPACRKFECILSLSVATK